MPLVILIVIICIKDRKKNLDKKERLSHDICAYYHLLSFVLNLFGYTSAVFMMIVIMK